VICKNVVLFKWREREREMVKKSEGNWGRDTYEENRLKKIN